MATFLPSKTAGEVVRREWTIPVDSDDAPSSVSLSATGVTIDANSFEGDTLVLTLSGGTAAATGTITATVTTDKSRTLVETLYVPVIDSPAQIADTARDYVNFAMRKIVGNGETPDAAELDDALERLNGMIARWREGGADIGAPFPITANSVIYCPDYAADAIRFNLRVSCHDHYDAPITPFDANAARRGLQLVMHKNLPDERGVEYF